jgi:hypothetical protein
VGRGQESQSLTATRVCSDEPAVPLRAAQDHDAPVPDARSLPRSSRTASPSNGPTTRRYRGVRIKDLDPQVLTIAQSCPGERLPTSVLVFSSLGRGIGGGTQPTLSSSSAMAPCGVKRFAKRKSASRTSSFLLVNPSLFSTSQIERVGWYWPRIRCFGASQGQSWGQYPTGRRAHLGTDRRSHRLQLTQRVRSDIPPTRWIGTR